MVGVNGAGVIFTRGHIDELFLIHQVVGPGDPVIFDLLVIRSPAIKHADIVDGAGVVSPHREVGPNRVVPRPIAGPVRPSAVEAPAVDFSRFAQPAGLVMVGIDVYKIGNVF